MRAFSLLLIMVASGCGEGTSAPVACRQTFSGDETATRDCLRSLCKPTGESYSSIGLDSTGHLFQLQADGTFAVGTYRDADLRADSTLSVSANGKRYEARAGSAPLAGQSITLVLSEVKQPSSNPCDGEIHGTLSATLVEFDLVSLVVGTGRVNASITF